MAESSQSQSMMQVSLPQAGEVAEYHLSSDIPVKFNFYVSEVLFSCNGMDLLLTGSNGGVVVLKDYLTMAQHDSLPMFELHGGEAVPGNIYLFAFSGAGSEVETAAGTPGGPSEMDEYLDDPVNPGNVLQDPAHGSDGSTSLLNHGPSLHHGSEGVLAFSELFSDQHAHLGGMDQVGHVPTLFGSVQAIPDANLSVCSLVDTFDPLDDVIQHAVQMPHYL